MAATLAANVSSVHPYHLQNLPKFAIMFETLLMLALAPFIRGEQQHMQLTPHACHLMVSRWLLMSTTVTPLCSAYMLFHS